jgi:uncharacterized protein YdeI (YjbR/CyaY-like superfamily)
MDWLECPTPSHFRRWLEAHHATAKEVVVLLHKVRAGRPSITWNDGIDEALCFGWIDGVRQPIDADSYTIRFTPRRPGSQWSQVNIKKVEALRAQGRMAPAGEAAFEAKVIGPPRAYSPKDPLCEFEPGHAAALAAQPQALAFWDKLPPSARHKLAWWVTSAKLQATRDARMAKLIAACAAGKRLM